MENDAPLSADVAELNREAQKAVDREIAARVELQAAIDNRVSVRETIVGGSAAAVAFIDAYTDPTVANPEPIAPEVAAPAPVEEPPVFTDVATVEVQPDNTSGGESGLAEDASGDEVFDFIPPEDFFPPIPTEPTADSVADPLPPLGGVVEPDTEGSTN